MDLKSLHLLGTRITDSADEPDLGKDKEFENQLMAIRTNDRFSAILERVKSGFRIKFKGVGTAPRTVLISKEEELSGDENLCTHLKDLDLSEDSIKVSFLEAMENVEKEDNEVEGVYDSVDSQDVGDGCTIILDKKDDDYKIVLKYPDGTDTHMGIKKGGSTFGSDWLIKEIKEISEDLKTEEDIKNAFTTLSSRLKSIIEFDDSKIVDSLEYETGDRFVFSSFSESKLKWVEVQSVADKKVTVLGNDGKTREWPSSKLYDLCSSGDLSIDRVNDSFELTADIVKSALVDFGFGSFFKNEKISSVENTVSVSGSSKDYKYKLTIFLDKKSYSFRDSDLNETGEFDSISELNDAFISYSIIVKAHNED